MKNLKILILLLSAFFVCVACDDCGCSDSITYRPEIGVGYVFMYDSEGNVLHPVEGAKVTVKSIYETPGMFGKFWEVAEESCVTDAEGRYQARFAEKACYEKEMVYCNTYLFLCEGKYYYGIGYILDAQNNIKIVDTIKLYK